MLQGYRNTKYHDLSIRRAESRGGLREFYPVSLLITAYELESGLLQHKSCTPILLDWLRKDAIASHASDD